MFCAYVIIILLCKRAEHENPSHLVETRSGSNFLKILSIQRRRLKAFKAKSNTEIRVKIK